MALSNFDHVVIDYSPAVGITIACLGLVALMVREAGNTYYGKPRKGFGVRLDVIATVLVVLLSTIVILRFVALT